MNNISNTLRKRYILALTIIAILVIGSQLIVQYTIQLESSDSRVINIAGRQRMLSQRINKCIFGALYAGTVEENKKYMDELADSALLWERSHNGLQYGDRDLGIPGKNSAKVMMLFSEADTYYQKILTATKAILSGGGENKEVMFSHLQVIKDNEQSFLKLMDDIVFQYDAEAKSKIFVIRTVEIILMLFTFIVLVLEAKFIFFPAERSISETISEITESHENIVKLFEIAPAALFLVVPPELKLIKMNTLAESFLNDTIKSRNKESLLEYFKENLESDQDLIKKIINCESFEHEEAVLKSSESIKAVLVSSSTIFYKNTPSVILSMMDISKQKHVESILKKYATTDELTGLLNRHSGKKIMDNAIERANLDKQDLSVCFCDMDGLKYVNDNLGHEEGDWYIIAIAEAIKSNLREDDFAFRYGGDEIVIVFNNCNEEKSRMIIKRINNSIEHKKHQFQKSYNMSISIGVVTLSPKDTITSDDLIAKADNLMYEDKRRKKIQRID